MKNFFLVLPCMLLFGCASRHQVTSVAYPRATAMDSFKPILPAIKDTASADNPYDDGVMENPYDDGSGNPYDDLIEQEKQVAESARLAAQKAEEDKRLHDLMVKEVWGDCTPGDPVCSPMGKIQTDIKATH